MDPAEVATAPIGHNRPDPGAALRADIDEMLARFSERRAKFLASAEKAVVRDRYTAGDAADLVGLAAKVGKTIEAERLELTRPYDEAVQGAISTVRNFWSEVEEAMERVEQLAIDWKAAEDKRIADQQAEQAAAEEKLRAAQAPRGKIDYSSPAVVDPAPVKQRPVAYPQTRRAQVRGDLGHKLVDRTITSISVVDVRKVPLNILRSKKVTDAIISVARDFAKHNETLAGLKIDRGTTTDVR